MGKSKDILKRVVCLLLGIHIIVSSVCVVYADGGSSNRIATYINLSANKTISDSDLDIAKLTKDQLRFLGVFCSNYFVPFSTEFGSAAGTDTDEAFNSMKEALQTGLSFSDEYAQVFAENIVGLARSSAQCLEFAASVEFQKDYIIDTKRNLDPSYYNFLTCMLGSGSKLINKLEDSELRSRVNDLKYGYWGFVKDGEFVPVFDCFLNGSDGRTASQVAFAKCLEAVNPEKGYGFNVWDLNSTEVDGEINLSAITESEMLDMSILGMDMYVDCLGDILVCGFQHQVVAIPGCVNPYVWRVVDGNGDDWLQSGLAYNAINFMSMDAADMGKGSGEGYLYSNIGPSMLNGEQGNGGNANTPCQYKLFDEKSSMFAKWQQVEILDITYPDGQSYADKIKSAWIYVLGYADAVPGSSNWSIEKRFDGIYAIAPYGIWAGVSSAKLEDDYKYSNQEKHDKLVSALNTLSNPVYYQDKVYGNETPISEIRSSVSSGADYAKENIGSDVQETTQEGTASVTLKEMTPNLAKLESQLANTGNTLRIYRGTTESDMDQTLNPWSAEAWKIGFMKAVDTLSEMKKDGSEIKDKTYELTGYVAGQGQFFAPKDAKVEVTNQPGTSVLVLDTMIMIDSLGDYNWGGDAPSLVDYNAFPISNYINDDGTTHNSGSWDFGDGSTFASGYSDIQEGKIAVNSGVSESAVVCVYSSYLFASLYEDTAESKSATIGKLGYRMCSDNLPVIPSTALNIDQSAREDLMVKSIKSWIYYILHPTEGCNYVVELISNKLNAFLVGWHNDMVGTNGVGATTGITAYRNQVGYVTMPDLSEMEWTASLILLYEKLIPLIIIAMVVTMLFAFVTGILSVQKAIIGTVIFSLFLLLPVNLINGVVGTSNRVSQNLYGEKFTYWALVQQESYQSSIENASNSDNYQNYLSTLYSTNSQVYANQGSESIVLKWQAPKKMASLVATGNGYNALSGDGKNLLNGLLTRSFTGESYTDDTDSVYMFRSYLDISNFSRYIYRGIDIGGSRQGKHDLTNDITSNYKNTLKERLPSMGTSFESDIINGYTNKNTGSTSLSATSRVTVPMSSSIINDALAQRGKIKDLNNDDYVGISPIMFNFSIPYFNGKSDLRTMILSESSDMSEQEIQEIENALGRYTMEDFSGLASYGLYSENVFYYFSWALYDMGMYPEVTYNGYKNLLLGDSSAGFFYNTIGNGELKDFMDMKSLFTYIIPYLRQCNDIVNEWDDMYGIFLYEGVPYEEGYDDDPSIMNDPELRQKYWHNVNVARLYSMYCPWVDIMYDCSYAKAETISAMGNKYVVEDPLDPASYPDERPMIFSESEMADYGLSNGDLTKVEQLILKCNQGMEERMYELLNYYNFSDITLNTAAAMNCAFEFNNTFSENGIFTNNHNIYPQSFELNNFSYDAFLRFILSNNTGEAMESQDDFYNNVVNKSSTTTAIVMLLLDILSVYVLPGFKVFFIVAVFLVAILVILATAFRVDEEQKFIKRVLTGIVMPMIKFLAITIVFSFVVSLFMGTGNSAVTGSSEVSIQLGDPVTVMIAMVAINIFTLMLYYKVLKDVLESIKKYGKQVLGFTTSVFGGIGAMVVGGLSRATSPARSGGSSGNASEGTDTVSGRARRRSGNNVEDYDDRKESTRRNDIKRDTIRPIKEDKTDTERSNDINKKTSSGIGKLNS